MLVVVFNLPRGHEGGQVERLARLPNELLGGLAGNAVYLGKGVWSEHCESLRRHYALFLQELHLPRFDAG